MKKLTKNTGETIAETLVAVLITTMALTILAGAIVTAARVNAREKNQNEALILTQVTDDENTAIEDLGAVKITIKEGSNVISQGTSAHKYRTKNGYYYYE